MILKKILGQDGFSKMQLKELLIMETVSVFQQLGERLNLMIVILTMH